MSSRLALVVPSFNEAERLPRYLPGLAEALTDIDCVIQVVDDGSRPGEAEGIRQHVESLRSQFSEKISPVITLPRNQGKGAAIKAGWRVHATCPLLGFVDADGAVSPGEVRRLLQEVLANPDRAYFASRVKMLGRQVDRSPLRHLMGRVFATAASVRLDIPVYDTQCGLKIIPAAVFRDNDLLFVEDRFAFDLELLVSLVTSGTKIHEVPVDWKDVEGSKVNVIRDSLRMYGSLNRIAAKRNKWTSRSKNR